MLAESDVQSISSHWDEMISGGCIAWHFRNLWHLGTRYSFDGFSQKPHLSPLIGLLAAALLAGCQPEAETAPPHVRPVRTITVAKRNIGDTVSYTGRIQAENEAPLAFRIAGRMVERPINVGDHAEPGQIVAKLEPQDELNALRTAQAGVVAAQARINEVQSNFERQKMLLARDIASQAQFEQAEAALKTARAQLDMAQAQLKTAKDRVSDTELRVDAAGTVVATGAEPGEVVQAGQMIVRVARREGRDAVFDVPARLLQSTPSNPEITVSLVDDPAVTAMGRVREVSPQADPVTRTFEVKVGLTDPPAAMRLGSTVVGRMKLDAAPVIDIPATALTELDRRPAVWIVDPKSLTVSLRNVEVARNDPATVGISEGLDTGEIVVTAGTQALHPGQKIRLLDSRQ
jgi:RND family efflux transporter MFP subunit